MAFLLSRLLEQLCARLAAWSLATQELHLKLTLEQTTNNFEADTVPHSDRTQPRQTFHRTLRLPVPLLDPRVFLKLLQLDLNTNPPGAPIVGIHLSAEPVRPRAAQNGLFLPPSPEPEKLELTLAKIAGIVGHDKVGSLQLLDTHRPERFLMRHFAPNRSSLGGKNKNGTNKNGAKDKNKISRGAKSDSSGRKFAGNRDDNGHAAPKPLSDTNLEARENAITALRIFRPPVQAAVTLCEGRPTRIVCPRRKEICGEILWAAGPWRASGDWWEQEGWARDEWDIALQEAAGITLYRLVRDLLDGQWRIEGSYD